MKDKGILFVLGLIGLVVLAACSGAGSSVATQADLGAEPTPTEAMDAVGETPTMAPAVDEAAEPTATEQAEVVEVRAGLEASNPSDFEVASGEVQLVEFFAFW